MSESPATSGLTGEHGTEHTTLRVAPQTNEDSTRLSIEPQLLEVAQQMAASGGQINIMTYAPQISDQRQWNQKTSIKDSEVKLAGGDFVSQTTDDEAVNLTNSSEKREREAMNEVVKLLGTKYAEDCEFPGIPEDELPVVFPRMVKISFYEGEAADRRETYDSIRENVKLTRGKELKLEELLCEANRSKFVCLLGFPGSGKTVCAKRLARSSGLACFYMKFADMNYGLEMKLTLRELLLDNLFPCLSEEVCCSAFNWMIQNDHKCVIIMDGFDQADWSQKKLPPKTSYNNPMHVWDLVANLCNRHFLPGASLLMTSRPHCMICIPKELRPAVTILVEELSLKDLKLLCRASAGSRNDSYSNKLFDQAEPLIDFFLNPLMLNFLIKIYLDANQNFDEHKTLKFLLENTLENFRYSSEHARHDDLQRLGGKLARIAYKCTRQSMITITLEDLEEEGLRMEDVQDILAALHGRKVPGSRVFDNDTKLYFFHRSLQEHFTAIYIENEMALRDYKEFVKNDLFHPRWTNVRRFLCGRLMLPKQTLLHSTWPGKRRIFIKRFNEEVKRKMKLHGEFDYDATSYFTRGDLFTLWGDVRECNSNDVTNFAAKYFPTKMILSSVQLTSSDTHALAYVLKKVDKLVELIVLSDCDMDTYTFSHICNAIKSMPGSIGWLKISFNLLTSEAVDSICEILPKIRRLNMQDCFSSHLSHDVRRSANDEERNILQSALNNLYKPGTTILVDNNCTILRKRN